MPGESSWRSEIDMREHEASSNSPPCSQNRHARAWSTQACLSNPSTTTSHPPGRVQRLHGVAVRGQQGGKVERRPLLARLQKAGGGSQGIEAVAGGCGSRVQ